MPWGDLCEGKKREEEEECWGIIGCRGEAVFWLESNGGEGDGHGAVSSGEVTAGG
jgi:hypothetical protein